MKEMKTLHIALLVSVAIGASCDLRSGTAQKEMEKFSGTPTPTVSPTPTLAPIDPADIVRVEPRSDGSVLSAHGPKPKETVTCDKFDQVNINRSRGEVIINGPCSKITFNGDGNTVTADAAVEFVFNGTENKVKYARYVNGVRPIITQNQPGNEVEKVPYVPAKTPASRTTEEK